MSVGVATLELHIPHATNLKEKRAVLKSMLEGVRTRFNISAAEVDYLDKWQRAAVGLACVSNSQAHCNEVLDKAVDWIEMNPRAIVTTVELEFH